MTVLVPAVLCGHCGSEVSTAAVSPVGLLHCPGCTRMLDLDPILPQRRAPRPEPEVAVPLRRAERTSVAPLQLRRDAPFPMPDGAELERSLQGITLRVPDNVGRFPVAAALGALGLGAVFYALATAAGAIGFNLGVTATTLTSAYLVMQAVVNQRHFRADRQGLHTGVGPLPWLRPAHHLPDVDALFVERNWTEDGRTSYRFIWELYARTRGGERIALLEGASDPVLVHWLGQQLAERLGVTFSPAPDPSERSGP